MNKQLQTVSPFDSIRQIDSQGQEYWSARDMQSPLGYEQWRRFEETIERAMIACQNSGYNSSDHFADVGKTSPMPNGGTREIQDYHLTRFACYLTAMNGDPRKPEIAAAQTYFAIKTREAETNSDTTGLEKIVGFLLEEVAELRALTQSRFYVRSSEPRNLSRPSLTLEEKVYQKIQYLETRKPPTERDVYRYFRKNEQPTVVKTMRSFYMKGRLLRDTSGKSPRYRSNH